MGEMVWLPQGTVTRCGICRNRTLKYILDLGDQPMAERDDGHTYPLALVECDRCGLVQLNHIVPQKELFPLDHPYSTGNTRALRDHFRALALELAPQLKPGDLVVDIGANDGTFLAALKEMAPQAEVLAVEPTGQAGKCRDKGVPVTQGFWTAALGRDLVRYHKPARIITASNVLAHVPDPHDFLSGVSSLLDPDVGEFITENHDWASVVNGLQIDTIYHEHLRYYSVSSLGYLLAMHGYLISEAVPVASHGGSFRITARSQRRGLSHRADAVKFRLRVLLHEARDAGPIYGIGAATRASPLIHYAGLEEYLACVCEVPGSDKIGRMMPGTQLPIVDEKQLITDQPPHALLFPWHLAASIVPVLRAAGYQGKFIVPLPAPEVLDG
jgi:C-methyltransferase C-terminal domain/Putative zinc binding domain/Methyltransferase domain